MTIDRAIEEQVERIQRMRALKKEIRFLALDAERFEAGRGSKFTEDQFNHRVAAARLEYKALGLGTLDTCVSSWLSLIE